MRAGQVAIMGGAFRYFCDATCKASYVDVASKRPTLDAMTADPPSVTSGVRDAGVSVSIVSSGIRAPEPPAFPPPEPEPEPELGDVDERETDEDAGVRDERPAPATLRSVPVVAEEAPGDEGAREAGGDEADDEPEEKEEAKAPPPRSRAGEASAPSSPSDAATVASLAGVGAGLLAAVVSLAGDAAGVARLPLALAAAALVVAQAVLRAKERTEVSRWVVAAPVGVAAVTAAVAALSSQPRADAHAAFVGLAAAAALAVDVLVSRGRRDVDLVRARNASALAVRANILRARDGESIIHEVDAAQVKPGEQVVVEAGEVVAVDGVVAAGTAEVAPWHESPVVSEKREGDAVVAGATVVSGRLRVTATFSGPDRAWLRLAHGASRIELAAPLVETTRRWIERGAPIAAVLVGGATYANNGSWTDVVVAACGGGFALAAASAATAAGLAHARGHVAAQRRGIVYKDADAFDGAGRTDVAVVCSRGTILLGEPELVAVEAVTPKGPDAKRAEEVSRVLSLAAGAEMASSHPFAAAVLRAARARNVRPENVRSALVHSGLGVTALAPSGDKVIVGSRAFLLQEKVSVAIADTRVSELEAQGRSVLLVAVGGRLVGLLALQDGLRPGARAAVQRLHDARIEPVLLSGEARDTCETIARSLDIEHVRPEILPADRGAEVRALADGGHVVAAVGHAASDDGALGAADVSVAMGAAGAAPGEWGVTLASDDVRDAALALTVPRACRERAKTALIVGAAAQALAALGIAFGVAPPVIAPVLGIVAAAAVLAVVREPTLPSSR